MSDGTQTHQADILWQSQDGTARFRFTLQPHGNVLGDEYSRFIAEGPGHAALPNILPVNWEQVSGYVKTFMNRLGPVGPGGVGYSIDLSIPGDTAGRANDACNFGCGASEQRLRQVSVDKARHNYNGL